MASKYLQREAYVDVYLAHHMANKDYPYRVQQIKEASPTTVEKSTKHILDSSIGKDYTNQSVIDKANYLDVTTIVPCDVIGDHEETVKQVIDMLQRIDGTDKQLVVPIQGSSPDTYMRNAGEMRDGIEDHGYSKYIDRYAIGGVKEKSGDQQRDIVRAVCTEYDTVDWHLLGAGMSRDWILFIRENPDMLVSLDTANPVIEAKQHRLLDYRMEKMYYDKPRGKHSTFPNARLVEFMLTEFNYMISDGPNEDELLEILDTDSDENV